jgi:hypothetical protein
MTNIKINTKSKMPFLVLPLLIFVLFGLAFTNNHPSQSSVAKSQIGTKVLGANTSAPQYQLSVDKLITSIPDTASNTQRVTIKISIKNLSGKILQISPGLQMFIIDQNKTSYNATAKYLPFGLTVGGPLANSASRTQDIDFEIPKTSVPKQFIFQLDGSTPTTRVSL